VGGSGGLGAGPPLQDISGQIAKGISAALTQELRAQLGPDGTGPLGEALSGSSAQISAAAAAAVRHELGSLIGPCDQQDTAKCVDRRVHELGRAASSGMMEGLRVPLLLLSFGLGAVVCAAMLKLLGWSPRRRELRGLTETARRRRITT
jgi:hypothetical protein